jgi:hypothetical protein
MSASDMTATSSKLRAAASETLDDVWSWGRATTGAPDRETATRTLRSGQMSNQFTMMVQVAVTLAVGVLIVGEIFNALPDSGALSNASAAVENQTGTAFELAPIVLIVVVASLVIGVVRRI